MPKKHVPNPRLKTYTTLDLECAIKESKGGNKTIHVVSRDCGIPYHTLHSRIRGPRGATQNGIVGHPKAIPAEQESRLALHLETMEKWGFGLSKKEVNDIV